MCRLAAFPPGFSREAALEILKNFENNNVDGTGAAWVNHGKFVVEKYPKSLTKVLRRHKGFLDHMPHNGWTIAHLRAASHGKISVPNTHPFIAGNFVVCHNGVFSEYKVVKLALGNRTKFLGETDSEAATHLISTVGPKRFAENIDFSGVFLALNIRGDLWAIKTSGQLEIEPLKGERTLLASTFDPTVYEKPVTGNIGWYHFDRNGQYIKHRKIRDSYAMYNGCGPAGCGNDFGGRFTHPTGNTQKPVSNIHTNPYFPGHHFVD